MHPLAVLGLQDMSQIGWQNRTWKYSFWFPSETRNSPENSR